MKKTLYFVPPVLALLLYIVLGFAAGFGAISPWVWLWIAVMFVSSAVLFKAKWYGCIGGLIVGGVLIYMSTQYTGQVIDIERPLGIILCAYYLICGYVVYKKASGKRNTSVIAEPDAEPQN